MAVDENKDQLDPSVPESYEHLLEDYSHFAPPSEGEIFEGRVLKVTPTEVIVDFGYKSEGLVPIEQFRTPNGEIAVQPGDLVDVMIDRGEAIDRFADSVTVEEVMSHDVFTVQPDTSLKKAVGLLRRHRIGSLPVVRNKNLVGIITRSDILDFVLSGLDAKLPVNTNKKTKRTKSADKRTGGKGRE